MPSTLPADLDQRLRPLAKAVIGDFSRWYQDGYWHNTLVEAWAYTQLGPAGLCATMHRLTPADTDYLALCVDTIDHAIATYSHPYGYFLNDLLAEDALTRIAASTRVAWSFLELGDALDPTRRASWYASIKANVESLEVSGDLLWYANGNWSANNALLLWMAAAVAKRQGDSCGAAKFKAWYERGLAFVQHPDQTNAKWAGLGLIVSTPGTQPDGSDAVGYLTETTTTPIGGASVPTFDGEYSMLVLDHLTQLYVLSRDARVLKLINTILGKVMPLWNTTTWLADYSGGSRHNSPGWPCVTAAFPVVALLGQRLSNTAPFADAKVLADFDTVWASFLSMPASQSIQPGISRLWASSIATTLRAASLAKAKVPA